MTYRCSKDVNGKLVHVEISTKYEENIFLCRCVRTEVTLNAYLS